MWTIAGSTDTKRSVSHAWVRFPERGSFKEPHPVTERGLAKGMTCRSQMALAVRELPGVHVDAPLHLHVFQFREKHGYHPGLHRLLL